MKALKLKIEMSPKYAIDDLNYVATGLLQLELEECQGLEEVFESMFPPAREYPDPRERQFYWEESDEVGELREYMEAIEEELETREFEEMERI